MKHFSTLVLVAGLIALVLGGPGPARADDPGRIVIDFAYGIYSFMVEVPPTPFTITGAIEDEGLGYQESIVGNADGSSTIVWRLEGADGDITVQIDLDALTYGYGRTRKIGTYTVTSGTEAYADLTSSGQALQTVIMSSPWGIGGGYLPYGYATGSVAYHLDSDPPENEAPVADLLPSPAEGPAPLTTWLYAQGSWDEDGIIVEFEWDFDSDGVVDLTEPTGWLSRVFEDPGTYTVTVRAIDEDGASDTASATVVVGEAAPPPTVSLTAPIAGSTVSGTAVLLAANASDLNGIAQVQFFVDGTWVGWDNAAPYQFTWNSTSVANGTHSISATAVNTYGVTASDTVSVIVNNGPAPPTIISISPNWMNAGSKVQVIVTGTGFQPGATLDFANGTGKKPTVRNASVVSGTTITAQLRVNRRMPSGNHVWDVVVTNPNGQTAVLTAGFTVIK